MVIRIDETGCSMRTGIEKLGNVGRALRIRDNYRHLVLDWWIVLIWLLKNCGVKVCTVAHRSWVRW
jgi:hypothetical protein